MYRQHDVTVRFNVTHVLLVCLRDYAEAQDLCACTNTTVECTMPGSCIDK